VLPRRSLQSIFHCLGYSINPNYSFQLYRQAALAPAECTLIGAGTSLSGLRYRACSCTSAGDVMI
jgi:hypothetical protein